MNTPSSYRQRAAGFTVIELVVVIVVAIAASALFFMQKQELQRAERDEKRKISVNAMYYSLEEVYYKQHGNYPQILTKDTLTAVDPNLLTDTYGNSLGQKVDQADGLTEEDRKSLETFMSDAYEYRYEPVNCNGNGECKSYTLHVELENEGPYEKTSRNN